jgi:hypothetical protein
MKWMRSFGFKSSKNNQIKYFCIGANKTGTTSLKTLFTELGFKVAPQDIGEKLIDDWGEGKFDRIIAFAKSDYNFFQDIPFSLPGTFKAVEQELPNCKFILTIRTDENEWYNSLINFHTSLMKTNGVPTAAALKSFNYVEPGWMWKAQKLMYGITEDKPYSEEQLKSFYTEHNAAIVDYFKNQPDKLIVINLKNPDAAKELGEFIERNIDRIPWENKS